MSDDARTYEWLSINSFCERHKAAGLSPSLVRQLAGEGKLPAFKASERKWLVRSDALDAMSQGGASRGDL